MIDLREKDRAAICELAGSIFSAGTVIWACGSRVKGTNHDTSDLNLVVHFPENRGHNKDYNLLDRFIVALRDSNIPIIVQVMDWHAIPEHFKENIQACYHTLWTSPSGVNND